MLEHVLFALILLATLASVVLGLRSLARPRLGDFGFYTSCFGLWLCTVALVALGQPLFWLTPLMSLLLVANYALGRIP